MEKKPITILASKREEIAELLKPYQLQVDEAIKQELPSSGVPERLLEACHYALLSGGKRFRPALTLMVAKAIGYDADVMPAALSVEYFHTASLVADDLPCMDNDDERREMPTVHKKYGETTAMLVTYALISEGYQGLVQNAEQLRNCTLPFSYDSNHICALAVENASYNTGLLGATGGQFMDIYPPELTLHTVLDIINKKTTSLFELSFVLGWLYGGGELARLSMVKKAAGHFGRAFQIADDIGDMDQDIKNKRAVNLANVAGIETAYQMFHEELRHFERSVQELALEGTELLAIAEVLRGSV